MRQYLDLLNHVVSNGEDRPDRTGIGTKSVFGYQMRFDLNDGFPAITTKKLAWKAMVSELLWFLEGSTDERRLCEILHGTRDTSKRTIWSDNAEADYWGPNAKFEGDLGLVYGHQWRKWETPTGEVIDQISNLIDGIKKDPYGRRHIVSAWNPYALDKCALPPCHTLFQFYVSGNGKLSCQLYQRSMDIPLGCPFNIASYALLTHMVAKECGLGVGDYVHTIGDAHIYNNQLDTTHEQLIREPLPLPTLWLNPEVKSIFDYTMDDIKLTNYTHHEPIKYEFAT